MLKSPEMTLVLFSRGEKLAGCDLWTSGVSSVSPEVHTESQTGDSKLRDGPRYKTDMIYAVLKLSCLEYRKLD